MRLSSRTQPDDFDKADLEIALACLFACEELYLSSEFHDSVNDQRCRDLQTVMEALLNRAIELENDIITGLMTAHLSRLDNL